MVLVTLVAVFGVVAPAVAAGPAQGTEGSSVATVSGTDAVPDAGSVGSEPVTPAGPGTGPSAGAVAGPGDGVSDRKFPGPGNGVNDGEFAGPGDGPGGGMANANVSNVTLVSGQRVTVIQSGNETSYVVDADVEMRKVETPRGTYVYPAGTDFSTFDPSLFNVDLLVDQGLTDEESGAIPVIVERDRSGGAVGPQRAGAGGLAGFEADRTLESVGAVAGTIDKATDESTPTLSTQTSAPTVERVTLDRYYELDLDDSTEAINADSTREERDLDGSGVRVAVLDTGVSDTHPDLDEGTVVDEVDVTQDGTVEDDFGHGTHVASILAGDGDASDGNHTGVAPGAEIMNVRVLDSQGRGRASWIIQGMEYAVDNSADVISMSLGVRPSGDSPIAEAVDVATERGVVVVIAAGNSGPYAGTIGTPGIAPSAITVGAMDHTTGEVARFSSRGPTAFTKRVKPEVVAPGVDITAACAQGALVDCSSESPAYATFDGTSMAAPHVSGVVALMLEENPDWSPPRVKDTLMSTASSLGGYTVYDEGTGMVNATRAVDPRVIVENASLDVGVVDENGTVTRVVTVRNTGDEARTLSADVVLRDAESGQPVGDVSVNRTEVTVPAGGSADVLLSIDASVPEGTYSGRLTFSGGDRTYSAAFGFTRARTITVEKRPTGNTSVEDDKVWVIPHTTGVTARLLTVSNGTAEFIAEGPGNYTVLSTGTDESTDGPVLMMETAEDPDRIVLDEGGTAVYDLNASELRDAHGPMVNLSTQAELRTGPFFGLTVLDNFTDTRRARFSEQSELAAVVEYVMAPASEHDGETQEVDVDSLYHLVYATPNVTGPETFEVDRSTLATDERTYYRSSADQRLQMIQLVLLKNTTSRWSDGGYWWNLSGRSEQTVYLTPEDAGYYTVVRTPDRRETEHPWLVWFQDPAPAETVSTSFNRHPYSSISLWALGRYVYTEGYFQVDQGPARAIYSDPGTDAEMSVRINGSTVYEDATGVTTGSFYLGYAANGTVIDVTLDASNPGGLSTRTVTDYRTTLGGEDVRPPEVRRLVFEEMNTTSAVPEGESTVRVNFTEPVEEAVVLYAAGNAASDPVSADGVDETAGWTRADAVRLNDTAVRATVNVTSRHTSVAVYGVDEDGNVVATTVYDAVRTPEENEASSLLAQYANDEGLVDTAGLQDAISDWAAGEISTDLLQELIAAWASGEPVA